MLRAAGYLLAATFRAAPEAWRFELAVAFAHRLEPLIARTNSFRIRSRLRTDTVRETSLELVLMMLTRHGVTFTPKVVIEGEEALRRTEGQPTLIVGPHTMLSRLFVRYLEDQGRRPYVIDAEPGRVPGTLVRQQVLLPSASLLLKVRALLQDGSTIAAMIDRGKPEPRNRQVQFGGDQTFVSDALLQVAIRVRARIVFIATTLDDQRRVVIRLAEVAPQLQVEEVLAGFLAFVDAALSRGGVPETPSDGVEGRSSETARNVAARATSS